MTHTDTDIHAHEVIDLIRTARPALTLENIAATVAERFGPEARFHTCSAFGMTAEQTLQFLLVRGKVFVDNGRLVVQESKVCQH